MRVVLAQPRGFCAGVVRAIEIVERALEKSREPVYVRHEIVHNRHVVEGLKRKGALFVEELNEIPDGAVIGDALSDKVQSWSQSFTSTFDTITLILPCTKGRLSNFLRLSNLIYSEVLMLTISPPKALLRKFSGVSTINSFPSYITPTRSQ